MHRAIRVKHTEIRCSAWRDCMKSGSRMVFRCSSRYEKALPDGSFRCPMELHEAPSPRAQGPWTAEDPRSSRDPERRLLPLEERLPVVAPASPPLSSMAHRLPLFQDLAHREGTWERINRAIRERLRDLLKRDPQPSAGIVDSSSR
jgi:hypothetical protein